jgi:hypothetical protein
LPLQVEELESRTLLAHAVSLAPAFLANTSLLHVVGAPHRATRAAAGSAVLALPGQPGQVVPTTFTLNFRGHRSNDEVGLFLADDAQGRIGTLRPGDPGYAAAALAPARAQVLLARGAAAGTTRTLDLPGGRFVGLYVIPGGTSATFLAHNPHNRLRHKPVALFSLAAANPDHRDHLRPGAGGQLGFADRIGGRLHFTDLVLQPHLGMPKGGLRQPPTVTVNSPAPGLVTSQNVPITGQVSGDVTSGGTSLQARVDAGPFLDVPLDAAGNFAFTTALALDGSADGSHTVSLQATDAAGNVSPLVQVPFTLRTPPPTAIGPASTVNRALASINLIFSKPMAAPAFAPANYTLQVHGGRNDGQAVPIPSVTQVTPSAAQLNLQAPLANRGYRLTVGEAVTDLAGQGVADPRTFDFTVAQPVRITEMSPANGEDMVSVARTAVVRFDRPVDPTTVTTGSFYLIADGQPVPGIVRVSSTNLFATFFPTNPLPPGTEVRAVVDGSQIKDPQGLAIDGAGDGTPGGMGTADFHTLPLTRIPATDVFGYVYDSYHTNPDGSNIPVFGATIRVDAFPEANAVTDANGYFILKDMPAPSFFVHVDGTTATNAPAATMYPSVGKEFMSVPGQTTQLTMNGSTFNVYLPPMATGDIQPLSATQPTDVGFGAGGMTELHTMFPTIDPAVWGRLKVTFPAKSAQDNAGNAATQAAVIPVPPDRLPAPLPPGQNPKLVISIQALGTTRFDVPAPLTYPNIDNLPPGTKALIWSFNHDAGRWDVIGTGTVSADGSVITSDPGVGIKAPGWHFIIQGSIREDNSNKSGDQDPSDGQCNPLIEGKDIALLQTAVADLRLHQGAPNAADFLAHFLAGKGGDLNLDAKSGLAQEVLASHEFATIDGNVRKSVKKALDDAIAAGQKSGLVQILEQTLKDDNALFDFEDKAGEPDLYYAFRGTQGLDLSGQIDVVNGRYVGYLEYTIHDVYGFKRNTNFFGGAEGRYLQAHCGFPFFHTSVTVREDVDLRSAPPDPPGPPGPTVTESTATGFGSDPGIYYRYFLDNGLVIGGKTDASRQIMVVLPPNMGFHAIYYAPATNSWGTIYGQTDASGSITGYDGDGQGLPLPNVGGPDSTGDGIPDMGRIAIGLTPGVRSFAGDGIDDAAKLTMGLDPLGGRAFPTGVIANLTFRGDAEKVAVAGSQLYVATGAGLAVVDARQFNNPIVLGQLDVPGGAADVAVDPNLKIAALATGSGLVRVDVSDPMLPTVLDRPSTFAFTQVQVVDGFAYAAHQVRSSSLLTAVDLATGAAVQDLALPVAGTVLSLAHEGTNLYALVAGTGTVTLVTLDVSTPGTARVLGQLPLSVSDTARVFVGNGVAYVTGGGLTTVDVSDPTAPKLIHGADFVFSSGGLALNGSGLALVATGPGVSVYDVSNPQKTNAFQFEVPTPDLPRDVAIASGIAYVATGGSGLHVINYLPFDTKGVPPTVTISSPVADADPNTPGIQVLEGGSIPVRIQVTDDVQVRNVELLVNGQVIANNTSFPFDAFALAPSLASGATSVSIQARATDTGGNVSLSNVLTYGLVKDTLIPAVVRSFPADGQLVPAAPAIGLQFNKLLDPAQFNPAGITLTYLGSEGGGQDMVITPREVRQASSTEVSLLTPVPLPVGHYQLTLAPTAVADRVGHHPAAPVTGHFTAGFPHVIAPSPAPGNQVQVTSLKLHFDEPMNPTLPRPGDFALVGAGPDHVFGTPDDVPVPIAGLQWNATDDQLTLNLAHPLAPDMYRLTAPSARLRDRFGTPLDGEFLGRFPTGDGQPGGDFVFPFQVGGAPHFGPYAFPVAHVPSVPLASNQLFTIYDGGNVQLPTNADSPLLVDLNGDGLPDIVRPIAGTLTTFTADGPQQTTIDAVSVSLARPDGSFAPPVLYPVGQDPVRVLAADVNGDGKPDLITVNVGRPTSFNQQTVSLDFSVLLGNGDGTFGPEKRLAAGRDAQIINLEPDVPAVAVGDFTGHGKADLAVLALDSLTYDSTHNDYQQTSTLLLYAGNGDGTFATPPTSLSLSGAAALADRELFVADLNHDGKPDLVTPEQVLLSHGDGTFTVQPGPGPDGRRIEAVGDVTGDGVPDLLVMRFDHINPFDGSAVYALVVYQGKGDGTFQQATVSPNFDLPTVGTLADLTGDGRLDFIGGGTMSVALANADGTFGPEKSVGYNSVSTLPRLAAADVNHDGRVDLVASGPHEDATLVFLGNGDGTFQVPPEVPDTTQFLMNVRLFDANGDGKPDLFRTFHTFTSAEIGEVRLGKGDGTFGPPVDVTPPAGFNFGAGPALADVDGDGTPDAVLVADDTSTNTYQVLFYSGNGDGGFAAPAVIASGAIANAGGSFGPTDVALADVNGDGKPDVITASAAGLSVYPGDGKGHFGPAIVTAGPAGQMRVADLNGDGRADVIITTVGGGLSVYLGNADGTLTPAAPGNGLTLSDVVTIADVNGDGKPDLIVAAMEPFTQGGQIDQVFLYLGNGDGTFRSPTRIASGAGITSLVVGDFNNDGIPGLLVGRATETGLLLGNGDGTFQDPLYFDGSAVLAADLNGDHRLDVLGFDVFHLNTVSLQNGG